MWREPNKITVYPLKSAMYGAIDIWRPRTEDFLEIRIPHYDIWRKKWIYGMIFISPNATPWAATKWLYGRKSYMKENGE